MQETETLAKMVLVECLQKLVARIPELSNDEVAQKLVAGKVGAGPMAGGSQAMRAEECVLDAAVSPLTCAAASFLPRLHTHTMTAHSMHTHTPHTARQASLQECIHFLDRLVCQPLYTLHVGSCFRPVLLKLASALVELHIRQHEEQQQQGGGSSRQSEAQHASFAAALVLLLELAPHIRR